MKRHLRLLPVYFIAMIFIAAGIDKLFHYSGFVQALGAYVIFPRSLAPFAAMPLIFLEIAIGLALFVGRWRLLALGAAGGLLALFTAALTINYFVQPGSVCGCWFTVTLGKATEHHIAQNLVWLGLAGVCWWEEQGSLRRHRMTVPCPGV